MLCTVTRSINRVSTHCAIMKTFCLIWSLRPFPPETIHPELNEQLRPNSIGYGVATKMNKDLLVSRTSRALFFLGYFEKLKITVIFISMEIWKRHFLCISKILPCSRKRNDDASFMAYGQQTQRVLNNFLSKYRYTSL